MDRLLAISATGILACILGMILLNQMNDPCDARRADLERRLNEAGPVEGDDEEFQWQFDEWNKAIAGKPSVWRELVPPPPAPPPPPPPPPQQPDLAQMLADVKPTRQQVGAKVKFMVPDNPKGIFLGVGESINGASIESITRTEVVFTYLWKEMNQTLTLTKPRE